MMLDTRQIYPMSDFLRNHRAHVVRLKETRQPEVLTVNGRAEVILLDTESYESLMERLHDLEAISEIRNLVRNSPTTPGETVTQAEVERSQSVMQELVEETERLGLYSEQR